MLELIEIKDLRVGMYVVDTGLSAQENPHLYSEQGLIKNDGQLRVIRAKGLKECFIDTEKGTLESSGDYRVISSEEAMDQDLGGDEAGAYKPPGASATMGQEVEKAKEIYDSSVKFAKDLFKDARMGRQIDLDVSGALVEDIIDSVTRNADALAGLTKLRSFDEYTYNHCINVSVLSVVFGRFMGIGGEELKALGMAGLFHDVGKALIPDEILNKPAKLTDEEFKVMQGHPIKAYGLLKDRDLPLKVMRGIVEHHEKFNGRGYPRGISGEDMSEFARIMAVVDVYDALTSKRVYKKGMLPTEALKLMYGMRGKDFYPGHMESFVKCLGIYPVGSLVLLSNLEFAVVLGSNPVNLLSPVVKVIFDPAMRPTKHRVVSPEAAGLKVEHPLDHTALKIDPARYMN